MKNKIIAMILILASLFIFCVPASAARQEEYLSEIALVYAVNLDEAKAKIEGTDWKIFEQRFNSTAYNEAFIIYKTSTNVEDAITDLRVMDMYGGYNVGSYQKQLEASRQQYMDMIADLRLAAAEFKALYEANDEMAKLAYHQMNYHVDEGETGMKMGDFFLNLPSDEAIVTVLMEGSSIIVSNLLSLLAIGISGTGENTFAQRLAEQYANKDSIDGTAYYETAKALFEEFKSLKATLIRYDSTKAEYNVSDEEMTEEEYQFLTEYAAVANVLAGIAYGEGTLKDFIVSDGWALEDLYPIVAALSEGQRVLSERGLFVTVLRYSVASAPIDELWANIAEMEKGMKDENGQLKSYSVYLGVDRSIFDGDFAFTTEADREQALNGTEWTDTYWSSCGQYFTETFFLSTMISGVAFLVLEKALILFANKVLWPIILSDAVGSTLASFLMSIEEVIFNFFNVNGTYYIGGVGGVTFTIGFFLIVISLASLALSFGVGYYNPDYTAIPEKMVDVKKTDIGDKYIMYNVAKVYNDADGRNADFKAYQGKEWNALYYTKDANAGNCLLPNFVFSDSNNTVARRHQAIAMFGEDKAFDLNMHDFEAETKSAYVTVRYSNVKKAAADVPNVVGSMFATGALYVLTAVCGAGLGVGGTILVQKSGKSKAEDAPEAEATA